MSDPLTLFRSFSFALPLSFSLPFFLPGFCFVFFFFLCSAQGCVLLHLFQFPIPLRCNKIRYCGISEPTTDLPNVDSLRQLDKNISFVLMLLCSGYDMDKAPVFDSLTNCSIPFAELDVPSFTNQGEAHARALM